MHIFICYQTHLHEVDVANSVFKPIRSTYVCVIGRHIIHSTYMLYDHKSLNRYIDATNCLAGCSMFSFKNRAIEHPGKGMKPRHTPVKV